MESTLSANKYFKFIMMARSKMSIKRAQLRGGKNKHEHCNCLIL